MGTALVLGAAGCSGAHTSGSSSGEAVVGGTVDPGDPSVVAFLAQLANQDSSTQALCTGTIISPHVVLTAAHCVADDIAQAVVLVGTDLGQPDTMTPLQVAGVGAHPSYDPVSGAHDVGFVVLANATTQAPVPYNRTPVDGDVGQSMRVVGYGVTSADVSTQAGVKETASLTISAITTTQLMTPANANQPCHGDSGGPLLLTAADGTEQIAGLVSRGAGGAADCAEGSANLRVDAELDFIDSVVQQVESGGTTSSGGNSSGGTTATSN